MNAPRYPVFPGMPPVAPLSNLDPWANPQTLSRGGGAPEPGQLVPNMPSSPSVGGPVVWTASAHQYASCISGYFGAGLTSQKIIDAPVSRRNLLAFRNPNAAAILYLGFGGDASTNSVISLQPNQILIFDSVVPQDDIYVLSTVAAQFIAVMYSTVALPSG